jgi:hypothetical protein
MKHGHWVPISKYFLKSLPHDREYTELEAAYSLQLDFDNKNKVTITGYCNLWRWSKGKVYRFLDRMNIKILYPENTSKKRNQNGLITIHKPELKQTNNRLITDLKQTNNRLIRLIDNSDLQKGIDLKRTKDRLKTDLKQVTTIEPITLKPNPNPKKPKTFQSDSIEYRLANYLLNFILERNPNYKKPNIQSWAKNIDLMLRVDNRPEKEIELIIKWCQQSDFWYKNILSTGKLREKYDTLFLQMQEKKKSNSTQILTKKDIDKLNE